MKTDTPWISIKDQLPKQGMPVFACTPSQVLDYSCYRFGRIWYRTGYMRGGIQPDITHWMHKPENPNEL